MTITIDQYFDRYDISVQEISDLMSKYKSCTIYLIDGERMRYSFDDSNELNEFLKEIKPYVVPYYEHYKSNTFKAKLSRFFRKLFT